MIRGLRQNASPALLHSLNKQGRRHRREGVNNSDAHLRIRRVIKVCEALL